jgi:hypothetical protein
MFKRIVWVGVGVVIGVIAVAKAQAYIKAKTPDHARQFLLGPDQEHIGMQTIEGLFHDFNVARQAREDELNRRYAGSAR